MSEPNASGLSLLSARERDVLRLLRTGMLTPQIASNLAISVSTLNKHLASTRRKLGVKRTAHALLLGGESRPSPSYAAAVDLSSCDFANVLETCRTFDEAWDVLRNYADRLGVTTHSCGLIAEPPGLVTNGARAIKIHWPHQIKELWSGMGGEKADPTVPLASRSTGGFVVNNAQIIRNLRNRAPRPVLELGEALIDNDFIYVLHQPIRDSLTQAPLMMTFDIPRHAIDDFRRDKNRFRETLRIMAATFWEFVQTRRLMAASICGLSRRQREVLTLAARGFTVAETAEHMGVSVRSAEKTLAAARKQVGARTTSAAVYRALVYRALI
jgi:DNA-binding CsgD family transcriptional regulator